MAKWNVQVMFTGCVEVEVEADSYDEACEEAAVIADTDMVSGGIVSLRIAGVRRMIDDE
jgi:hypothetical protein